MVPLAKNLVNGRDCISGDSFDLKPEEKNRFDYERADFDFERADFKTLPKICGTNKGMLNFPSLPFPIS